MNPCVPTPRTNPVERIQFGRFVPIVHSGREPSYGVALYVGFTSDPERFVLVRERSQRPFSLRAVAMTLFVYGALVWLYAVAVQMIHPEWLALPLSHINFPPFNWRVDEIGILAFAVSAFGFFVWQLENTE